MSTQPTHATPAEAEVYVFPASPAQRRLWFLEQLDPGSPLYNVSAALRISGALDVAAFERALVEVVRRHESLRTTFREVEGEPMQLVHPELSVRLELKELRALEAGEREHQWRRLAQEDALAPFDLARGPLLRATLLRVGEAEHVLLLSLHHIVSDGWSTGVLVRELAALYAGALAGAPAALPPLEVQYADYSEWLREWMEGGALQEQLAYWKRKLAGPLPALELPLDLPRPSTQRGRGAHRSVELPRELVEGLDRLAQRQGCTRFVTLLAAYSVLLHRYSRQAELVIGSPIANRQRRETEGLIGFFVNMLALRIDLDGEPTFSELLQRARRTVLESFEHQEVPFEKLVEELQPARDSSRHPLFQTMFILQDAPLEGVSLSGLRLEPLEVEAGTSKVDLTLTVEARAGGLRAILEYDTDLFEHATAERMLSHLQTLLRSIVAEPEVPLSRLSLLTPEERRQLLVEWNDTAREYPLDTCLHRLIEAQVDRTPDAMAVTFEGKGLTYRELERRANQLAHHLRRWGVGPEVRVGLCAERSLEMVVGLLGILKAGGAYVPLDPTYPRERLTFMLEDARAPVLLTQEKWAATLPETAARVIRLDADAGEISQERSERPAVEVGPQHLAYVIYTSGSTGRPKGAMNAHRGVVNRLLWMQDAYRLGPGDVVLQKTSFSFDVSVWEFFWPLLVGARLAVARPEGHKDPSYLARVISEERVTTLHFVPSMLAAFLEAEGLEESCRGLRRVFCSGEALPVALQERFFARLGAELHNLYGPTEAAVDVSFWQCRGGERRRTVPIGRPIANLRLYILDKHLEPVPVGVPGELLIGGVGVGRGYLERPELTAERFIPDPFTGAGNLYRTGDLARFLPDGNIEFLGRLDHQVKLRGFRIELGEVEAALAHPRVAQVAVQVRATAGGEPRLVAYVVPVRAGELVSEEALVTELREAVRERLPEYMVPSAFVVLEALPLTPSGKLDTRALPEPSREARGEQVPPRGPVEEALAQVWTEVLGISGIGARQDFFELGGHSLLATRVHSRIRQQLGVELPLRALFEARTITALAARIEAVRASEREGQSPPLAPAPREGRLPLSFAQQRLWFLERFLGAGGAWHIPAALRLEGELDRSTLQRSLSAIVERHEALRTLFIQVGEGEVAQEVAPAAPLTVPEVDLASVPEHEREARIQRLAREESARPFDLSRGPLLRASLLRLGEREHVLLLTLHHIAADGWSVSVLTRELVALYEAFHAGQPSPLAPLALQYPDFAVWQRRMLQGEALEAQLRYWKSHLSGAPALLELPTDRPRPGVQSYRGALRRLTLPADLTARLDSLARREGATLFMLLLAAFDVLLWRYTGQTDLVVGTDIANRNRAETEGLIGFFVNQLALRVDLSGDPTFRELLGRVREVALGGYAHQDLPFEELVKGLNPERSMAYAPLFQVKLVLQNAPASQLEVPGLTLRSLEPEIDTAKLDLTLLISEGSEGLSIAVEYSTDLFERATIDRLVGHLRVLLEEAVTDPGRRISALELLTASEREQLLLRWNDTRADFPREACVHELFEAQAARTPEAIAVVHDGQQLTYGALDRRANQLARFLRRLGVGPEVRVGICLERSLEMVIAVWGVLKAGGAYVPLEPHHPLPRLSLMLQQARLPVVLTQERIGDELPSRGEQVIALDTGWEEIARESDAPLSPVAGPENLAYVIYTSGSTGQPKGVMVHHRGVVNYLSWCRGAYPVGEGIGAPVHSSLGFDLTVTSLVLPLVTGGRVVLLPEEERVEALGAALLAHRDFSLVKLTPTHLGVLGQQFPPEQAAGRTRALVVGGEALTWAHVAPWRAHAPGTRILNEYGPTETVVGCCVYELPVDAPAEGVIPMGRPIANTRLYVLDPRGRLVPVGVTGELYIGGEGVARGYLDQPELTAERFVADPFSAEPGARLYRTGDLARWRSDGNLEFLGRLDTQVKVRGFRIELGEIESVLASHPAVHDAAVVLRQDGPGEQRLVAYVAREEDSPLTVPALRGFLSERLPPYMLPHVFVLLGALPLTPNGKVDRRALPEPEGARPELEPAYVAPRSRVEEVLVGMVAELLQLQQVGVNDDFFELGGDSLRAVQLLTHIQGAFQVELSLRSLFGAPTVAGLARQLAQARGGEAVVEEIAATLQQVEQLSEEEVQRMLAELKAGPQP
jgi:amino acid adenylation domain-containing protein